MLNEDAYCIFLANRILTTQLQCGKEIYGLVLRQTQKEGVEEPETQRTEEHES